MKKAFLLLLLGSLLVPTSVHAEWLSKHYVDEFKQETENAYVVNESYFHGSFSNHIVSDRDLNVMISIDNDHAAIHLYEYGNQLRTNIFSDHEKFNITILDKNKEKHYLYGYYAGKGDRLMLSKPYYRYFISLIRDKAPLSVLVTKVDDQAEKYYFDIENDETFSTEISNTIEDIGMYFWGTGEETELQFTPSGYIDENFQPVISATTNLQDGFVVQIDIVSGVIKGLSYSGECKVRDGFCGIKFQQPSMTDYDYYDYTAVFTLDMEKQTKHTRKILGDNLQRLTGNTADTFKRNNYQLTQESNFRSYH